MLNLLRESLKTFGRSYRQYLVFSALFLTLNSFVFVPFIVWLFNYSLRLVGSGYLLNSELIRLILDWRSLLLTAVLFFFIVVVLFIEYATILVISHEAWSGRVINLADAFFTALKCIPRLLSFGLIHLLFLFFLVTPLASGPLADWFFSGINLPIFLDTQIQRSYIVLLLLVPVLLLVVYVSIRSIFTLHYIVLANDNMHKAIAHSFALTRKRQLLTIINLLLFNLSTVAVVIALLTGLNYLPSLLRFRINISLIENILLLISSYLTFVGALLLIPINMIFVTRLFYNYQDSSLPRADVFFQVAHSRVLSRIETRIRRVFQGRKLLTNLTLVACLALTFVFNYTVYQQAGYLRWNVMVISHRGDPIDAPENSLSAIRSALEKSVDMIEVDIQLTKDEIPVLHHDLTLRRMAGRPERVADLTWHEIENLDIGSSFSPEFAGETIPSLEAALLAVQDHGRLLLDLKPDERWQLLAVKTVELIEQFEMTEIIYVQSFHPQILQEIRALNPDIRIGQILTWAVGNLAALDVDFFSINQSMLSADFVRSARRTDRQVLVWTVNDEKNMRTVLTYDIDGIITHYPEVLQNLINWPAALEAAIETEPEETQSNP